jgi:hypothetical protein
VLLVYGTDNIELVRVRDNARVILWATTKRDGAPALVAIADDGSFDGRFGGALARPRPRSG